LRANIAMTPTRACYSDLALPFDLVPAVESKQPPAGKDESGTSLDVDSGEPGRDHETKRANFGHKRILPRSAPLIRSVQLTLSSAIGYLWVNPCPSSYLYDW
jgi:hypothetical protein